MSSAQRPVNARLDRRSLLREAMAGLPGAIGSVPDGMAASLLAGVNPIHGLYASMVGPIAGGFFASTRLLVVTTTSAAALAAGSTLGHVAPAERSRALFLLTGLAGALMALAGILRLGRFTRFVANSVMVGFLTGIAVNIVLGQIPDATGVVGDGSIALSRAIDVVLHPGRIDIPTLFVTLSSMAILVVASRTAFRSVAALAALAIPSIVVALVDAPSIATVADANRIPSGVPLPLLPELRLLSLDLVVGALTVAVIVLVQGSGVSESAPNPGGRTSDADRDFIAQGLGNIASGLFQGQPVGGSVGQTALNIAAGARTRWASIFSGVWMLVILVAFSGVVGAVVTATLAAVLIYAAIGAIRVSNVKLTIRHDTISQVAGTTTFICTLLLPVAVAVGIGVALSLLLQLNREALDLTVVRLVPSKDGSVSEQPVPQRLESHRVVVLDIYGSLRFAGARTLEARLPDPSGAVSPAVVLRLRGRTSLSTTAVEMLRRYADKVSASGGRMYLSGIDSGVADMLRETHELEALGPVEMVPATNVLGASSREAYERARAWLREQAPPTDGGGQGA
jgi:sulfate permease, SulP family